MNILPFPFYNISKQDVIKEFNQLKSKKFTKPNYSIIGNRLLDYYIQHIRYKTKGCNKYSPIEYWQVNQQKLIDYAARYNCKLNNIINLKCPPPYHFRCPMAMHLYQIINPTTILDPCIGWGGRMLGAIAMNIPYIGFDTNIEFKDCYQQLIDDLDASNITLNYKDARTVNYADLFYDCVFTSPPYINSDGKMIETYLHSPEYNDFNEEFMRPLFTSIYLYLQHNGWMCINVNEYMALFLITIFGEPNMKIEYPKHTNNMKNISNNEYIYCWNKK